MFSAVSRGLDRLLDHSTAAYILLALFVLSLVGAGNLVIASLVGLLLCLAGLTQGGARTDPWALAALLLYDLACLASAYACFGQFVSGYGVTHGLFPVLFLLTACLDQAEQPRSPAQKKVRDQDGSLKEVEVNTTLTLPRIVDGEKVWTSDTYSADGSFQVTVTELTDNIVLKAGDKHYNMSGSSTDAAISVNARKHTVELRNNSTLTLKRPAARRDQSDRRSGTA